MNIILDPATGRLRGPKPDGYARYDKPRRTMLVVLSDGGDPITLPVREAVSEMGKATFQLVVKGRGKWVAVGAR